MAGTREIARINGLKGGRPKGSKSTPHAVKLMIQEKLAAMADKLVEEQLRICLKGKFEPTRLQAIDKALDRLIGRAVQPHEGQLDSNIVLHVVTGVPEPDDG